MKNILVVGSNGQVGQSLLNQAHAFGFKAVGLDYPQIDITDLASVQKGIEQSQADLLINAAAYTAVDLAEEELEKAFAVNDLGTRNLGQACHEKDIPCFHISTDYVFDGHDGDYTEESATNPLSVYGKSKLAGEVSLQEVCSQNVILRSCWIYSEFGNNFLKTMLRLSDREELGIVADQFGGPTSALHVAEALLHLAKLHFAGQPVFGLYHFSGKPHTNWFEFARVIFEQALGIGLIDKIPSLKELTTDQYPTAAVRPKNSKLNISKIEKLIPELSCDWQTEITRILQVLKEEKL